MNKKIQILLIGKTGHGKSSLGNFLLGQKFFEVFDGAKSGTQNTMMAERNGLVIVDSPGLLDSENDSNNDKDVEHYKELINYIKTMKELNGILIVMNGQETRNSSDIQTMIKMICNTFEYKSFKFIGFAFTKYYGKKSEKEKIKKNKEEFVKQAKKIIEDFYGKKLENTLPYYFIDSDLDEPDDESTMERENIFGWAKTLPPFNPKELPDKDPRYKKMYEDYDNKTTTTEDSDYVYNETIIYKYIRAIDLNDNVITLDTKEIDRVKNQTPKKKSIWNKVIGGVMIGVGVLAAPFSAGASFVGIAGGIASIAGGGD